MKLDLACILVISLTYMVSPIGEAADWPQWQGHGRDGISHETNLLTSWPEGGPPRRWLFRECGLGYGGPSVVGDRLYIMGTRGENEVLFCLGTQDGEEIWSTSLGAVYENEWGDGPRGTPTVVDGKIYALAAKGNLVCVNAADGQLTWTTSLQDLGGELPGWGYSESPLVLDRLVLCTPGGSRGAVAALDRATGKLVWQCDEITDIAHYSSIVLAAKADRPTAVQLLESQVVGLDPTSGELLWSSPWDGSVAVVPTPVVRGNQVYITSGYGAGCTLIHVDGGLQPQVVYSNKLMSNHHGGVILIRDHVYGYADGKGWLCQEFETGKRVWLERGTFGKGAVTYADGHLYCLSENDGEIALVEASPAGWRERGRFALQPQTTRRKPEGKIWTHPVIANGHLYLRDQEYVYCYDIREQGNSSDR